MGSSPILFGQATGTPRLAPYMRTPRSQALSMVFNKDSWAGRARVPGLLPAKFSGSGPATRCHDPAPHAGAEAEVSRNGHGKPREPAGDTPKVSGIRDTTAPDPIVPGT